MRLVEGRKPEETSDAVCGAGPTGYSGAGSTEKGSTPINQGNNTGLGYEGKDQRDKGKNEQGREKEAQKLPTLYEYLMMKDETDFDLEKYDKIYKKKQKIRKNNEMTYEERIEKIMEKQIGMLTRQAQRLADEKMKGRMRKKSK